MLDSMRPRWEGVFGITTLGNGWDEEERVLGSIDSADTDERRPRLYPWGIPLSRAAEEEEVEENAGPREEGGMAPCWSILTPSARIVISRLSSSPPSLPGPPSRAEFDDSWCISTSREDECMAGKGLFHMIPPVGVEPDPAAVLPLSPVPLEDDGGGR